MNQHICHSECQRRISNQNHNGKALTEILQSSRYLRDSLRMTFILLSLGMIVLTCEVPTEVYDNPLDEEEATKEGINTPALVFFPDSVTVSVGSSASMQVFAMGVDTLGGSHIQMTYDKNKLSLNSATVGDFFNSGTEPIFIFENNASAGIIDIYTSFLGDSVSASGTGNLVNLVFSSTAPGKSTLQYTAECELVDPDDNEIVINGFGEGIIDAK